MYVLMAVYSCARAGAHPRCSGYPADYFVCPSKRGIYDPCCTAAAAVESLSMEEMLRTKKASTNEVSEILVDKDRDHDNEKERKKVKSGKPTAHPTSTPVATSGSSVYNSTIPGHCPLDGRLYTTKCKDCDVCPDKTVCNLCPAVFKIGTLI